MEESGDLMSEREVIIKSDVEELSRAAADLFVEIAGNSIDKRGSFSVALAGGSTPKKLYSLLASDVYRSSLDWTKIIFFFGDERHVPPDSEESNFRMANETLLGPLRISPEQVHRWEGELPNVAEAADNYEMELRAYLQGSERRLDMVLLGLGDDGHTASLFPQTPALYELDRLAVANWVEKLGAFRLTMTFPAINDSANIVFLVSGNKKAEALRSVIEGEFRPDDFPAQLVQPVNGTLYWLLDEPAAAGLDSSS